MDSICLSLGYGESTQVAFILKHLIAGDKTRKEIQELFIAEFADAADQEDIRSKKTSFDVFFSDVRRPFKTYYVSRGLKLDTNAAGIVSINKSSLRRAQIAIERGILDKLKGITPKSRPNDYQAILSEFGLDCDVELPKAA